MEVYSIKKSHIDQFIDRKEIIAAVESGFSAYNSGKSITPPVTNLDIEKHKGEVHIKSSYIEGMDYFCIKIASGFYDNAVLGLPSGFGLMHLFEARTGFLKAIFFDKGHLTALRTAAAGAISCKYLANTKIERIGIVGTGLQARMQVDFLAEVKTFKKLFVWGRSRESADRYVTDLVRLHPNLHIEAQDSPGKVVKEADVVITLTPSKEPLVQPEDIRPGMLMTAVGSDGPDKQEIHSRALPKFDKIVVDHTKQTCELGEIHHGLDDGTIKIEDIYAELGEVISGKKKGRENTEESILCDLTGVGVQDTAIANWAFDKALSSGHYETISLN